LASLETEQLCFAFFVKNNLVSLNNMSIRSRTGAADFFTYNLHFMLDGKVVIIRWVDEWAGQRDIPQTLTFVQDFMERLVASLESA